jgi:ParB family chromosome partitioning protein
VQGSPPPQKQRNCGDFFLHNKPFTRRDRFTTSPNTLFLERFCCAKEEEFGNKTEPILPANEGQTRSLIENLNHNGERLKVWGDVVGSKEKITAALVQSKVDAFLDSGEVVPDIEYVEEEITISASRSTGSNHTSSKVNDWYTPPEYIESARTVLGNIYLDPATSELAQKTVNAEVFYTEEDNGLEQLWEKTVWMNPPYSMPEIGKFIDKLLEEDITDWIVLTNNSSDTTWFHKLAEACSSMCFTKGRVGFLNEKKEKMATRQGQCFFYKGDNTDLFKKEFSVYGLILGVV